MLKLANNVKVFIPEADNDGNAVDLSAELNQAVAGIGGSTEFKALGEWVDNNQLYADRIRVVQFNVPRLTAKIKQALNALVTAIFTKGHQLGVSVEINGTLYILEDVSEVSELF